MNWGNVVMNITIGLGAFVWFVVMLFLLFDPEDSI